MKYFLYTLALLAYIGLFVLITRILYKLLHQRYKYKQWIIIGSIYIIGIFPIAAIIDYLFLLHFPFLEVLASIGFTIIGFFVYFILILLLFGAIVLIYNKIAKKHKIDLKSRKFDIISICIISTLSISICIYGFVSARSYTIDEKIIETDFKGMKIAILSDIHYGTTCSTLNKDKLIKKVNDTKSDIIFLVGDIFDNHISNLDKNDFTNFVNSFTSTYGTYAVLGNHELKQNSWSDAVSFYSDSNVKLLVDEEVIIDNKIRVVGRDDLTSKNRKNLNEIVSSSSLPLIVLDHQPSSYQEAIDVGASVQYSGHTHNGQLFPYNIAVFLYYQIKYNCPIDGVNKYGDFYLIICRGTSNWGFPYKTTGSGQIIVTKTNK